MPDMDQALELEEKKWLEKPYPDLLPALTESLSYFTEYKGKKYQFEIHAKKGSLPNEIIVMVECSKGSFWGNFWGKARYFVKSEDGAVRNADSDEFF